MNGKRFRPGRIGRRVALCAVALLAAGLVPTRGSTAQPTLTVFAAASLREAFSAIGDAFGKREGVTVQFNFGGSDALATQIVEGAPADVFASANEKQMSVAADKGAVVTPASVFARNRLTIVVPANNPAAVHSTHDLAKARLRLVLEAAEVPAGRYARDAIDALSHDPAYGPDFARRVLANVVSEETDVKAVATKVSLGEGDAGIVYVTDIAPLGTKVQAIALPAEVAKPAVYPIATVKASANAALAKKFVDYVLSPDGQAPLRKAGFLPAGS